MYHELSRSTAQTSRSQGYNVSASRNAIIQARISSRWSNLRKIISEPSATKYIAFKVMRSNIQIAKNLPRIARLHLNLVQSLITSQSIHCKCSRSKVKVTGSKVTVSAQSNVSEAKKCYNTATNRFSDFNIGMVL